MSEYDNSKVKDTVGVATELVKAIPIYQDIVQPAAREVGYALGTVAKTVNIALAPVAAVVWSYETIQDYILKRLSEKLKDVPSENIETPEISIAGPTLEALRFAGNGNELREMYANLLANALDKRTKKHVHPSFVEIIRQLSPKEALLLKFLSEIKSFPMICAGDSTGTADYVLSGAAKLLQGNYDSILTGSEIVNKFEEITKEFKGELDILASLDNFKRLSLVEIESYTHQAFKGNHNENRIVLEVTYEEILKFSTFGSMFVKTCIENKT